MSDELLEGQDMAGQAELDLFDQLRQVAGDGEKLEDPRCGRFDDVTLAEATLDFDKESKPFITLTWVGESLVRKDDLQPFMMAHRLNLPNPEAPAFMKAQYIQTLKALGVIPQKFEGTLPCHTPEAAEMLLRLVIDKAVGKQHNIDIKMNSSAFVNTTVRFKKKS